MREDVSTSAVAIVSLLSVSPKIDVVGTIVSSTITLSSFVSAFCSSSISRSTSFVLMTTTGIVTSEISVGVTPSRTKLVEPSKTYFLKPASEVVSVTFDKLITEPFALRKIKLSADSSKSVTRSLPQPALITNVSWPAPPVKRSSPSQPSSQSSPELPIRTLFSWFPRSQSSPFPPVAFSISPMNQ